MPDGVVQWFDPTSGEGIIRRGGRRYAVRASAIEPVARVGGARVHFDVVRDEGTKRAERVTLRTGMRVARSQSRFGDLTGARSPDAAGGAPSSSDAPELGRDREVHPARAVEQWASLMAAGRLDEAVLLYAPDAVLHEPAGDRNGADHIRRTWESSALLGADLPVAIRGIGADSFEAIWEAPDVEPVVSRFRVVHGLIAEQWHEIEMADEPEPQPASEPIVELSTSGRVPARARSYATERIEKVLTEIGRPVLHTSIRLEQAEDPARERPSSVRVMIDLDGEPVRAQVRAPTMGEAVDLLEARLRRRLEELADHRQALRRRGPTSPAGQWRHGDAPTERPRYHPRPFEDREIVRHKSFTTAEATVDEAIFDLEALDYDFFLFSDLASGQDAVVHRLPGGVYGLQFRAGPDDGSVDDTAAAVEVNPEPAPWLTLSEARDRLDVTSAPWIFFVDSDRDRGHVLYRRYDGHYGLITPAG